MTTILSLLWVAGVVTTALIYTKRLSVEWAERSRGLPTPPATVAELAARLGLELVQGDPSRAVYPPPMVPPADCRLRMVGTRGARLVEVVEDAAGRRTLTMVVNSAAEFAIRNGSELSPILAPIVPLGIPELEVRAVQRTTVASLASEIRELAPLMAVDVTARDGRLTLNGRVEFHGERVLPIFDRIATRLESLDAAADDGRPDTARRALGGAALESEQVEALGPHLFVFHAPVGQEVNLVLTTLIFAFFGVSAIVRSGLHLVPLGLFGGSLVFVAGASARLAWMLAHGVEVRQHGFVSRRPGSARSFWFRDVRNVRIERPFFGGAELRFEVERETHAIRNVRGLESLETLLRTGPR